MSNFSLDEVSSRLFEMKSHQKMTIFSISSTAKQEDRPYLTPIRICEDFILSGCVLFDQKNLLSLIEKIDGEVDIILTDSEKKIPLNAYHSVHKLNKKGTKSENDTISKICFKKIKKSNIYEFKPNDLTVNAVWSFLSQRMNFLNGVKVCILGAGNIGSKLALKLAECGAEVSITRRNFQKGDLIVSGLNLINPEYGDKGIKIYSDAIQASFAVDVLIGAANDSQVIDETIIHNLCRDCLIVDLGKNNLTFNAIKVATKLSMDIYRTDVTPAIESFVYELLKTRNTLKYSCGKKDLDFCSIVSGGFFGQNGDIIVDNISNPKFVLGISQGNGLLKHVLSAEDKSNIKRLKKNLNID